jgi:hypothetical protein
MVTLRLTPNLGGCNHKSASIVGAFLNNINPRCYLARLTPQCFNLVYNLVINNFLIIYIVTVITIAVVIPVIIVARQPGLR